jgi:hypothetical protein
MIPFKRLIIVPVILLASLRIGSADAPKLSPEVESFIRVRAPIVILAHVRLIDGTGSKQASIGSIEPGKHADLVVVKGDPSQRIADVENRRTPGAQRLRPRDHL